MDCYYKACKGSRWITVQTIDGEKIGRKCDTCYKILETRKKPQGWDDPPYDPWDDKRQESLFEKLRKMVK